MTSDDWFRDESVQMDLLRERAFNMRWAQQPEGVLCLTAADSDFPVCDHAVASLNAMPGVRCRAPAGTSSCRT